MFNFLVLGKRQILHSINGTFHCGNVTAILGPSGAGKTTLLNILTGYVKSELQGNIYVNGLPRDTTNFHKISSYIMQNNIIQPHLTTREALNYAAEFKLDKNISGVDRVAVIQEVIEFLSLENCIDTYSEYLSGGEKKRLSIAVELVNNPAVIFLDEPATGLDEYTVKQSIDLLKKISQCNRTVVCTIHQPSSSLFQIFDQVYIIADGYCVYNGSSTQLIPFLTNIGYSCPLNHTPADYIIELIDLHSSSINDFKAAIQNGKVNVREPVDSDDNFDVLNNEDFCDIIHQEVKNKDIDFPTSFRAQFFLLLSRMLLQTSRNKIILFIQFFTHISSGLAVGAIFVGIGNDASEVFTIVKYCVACTVYLMFTFSMMPILLFPSEIRLIKTEHFNRWYSLKAYYLALIVSSLPLIIILSTIFSSIVYWMTDQPQEFDRFLGFWLTTIFMALTSQSFGYFLGSIFSEIYGAAMGPAILAAFIGLEVHITGTGKIEPHFEVLMPISYSRHGLVSFLSVLFYKRDPLSCPDNEIYCPFAEPGSFMKLLPMPLTDYRLQLCYVLIFTLLFQITGYLALKCRLNIQLSSKITYYVKTILKRINLAENVKTS